MLGRIAKLYYEYNLTQQEVADLVGVSRIKVNRALAEARRRGIVQVSVLTDESVFVDEEAELCQRFGLQVAHLAPETAEQAGPGHLNLVGSHCMAQHVVDGMLVGVGLSQTLASIAVSMPAMDRPTTTFVPLQGTNPGLVTEPTPSNIARVFAEAYGAGHHGLAAPVLTSSAAVLDVLRNDPNVIAAFDEARRADVALIGLGAIRDDSSLILRGSLPPEATAELEALGAVGDINARFFDASGNPVHTEATDLVLGLTIEEFTQIPLRIAAAAGPAKIEAITAALRGGILNGLISDITTARALLAVEAR